MKSKVLTFSTPITLQQLAMLTFAFPVFGFIFCMKLYRHTWYDLVNRKSLFILEPYNSKKTSNFWEPCVPNWDQYLQKIVEIALVLCTKLFLQVPKFPWYQTCKENFLTTRATTPGIDLSVADLLKATNALCGKRKFSFGPHIRVALVSNGLGPTSRRAQTPTKPLQ